jgi:hypothetical protein
LCERKSDGGVRIITNPAVFYCAMPTTTATALVELVDVPAPQTADKLTPL